MPPSKHAAVAGDGSGATIKLWVVRYQSDDVGDPRHEDLRDLWLTFSREALSDKSGVAAAGAARRGGRSMHCVATRQGIDNRPGGSRGLHMSYSKLFGSRESWIHQLGWIQSSITGLAEWETTKAPWVFCRPLEKRRGRVRLRRGGWHDRCFAQGVAGASAPVHATTRMPMNQRRTACLNGSAAYCGPLYP